MALLGLEDPFHGGRADNQVLPLPCLEQGAAGYLLRDISPKLHLQGLEILHMAARGMTAVALQNLPFGLLCSQLQAAAKCLSIKLKPVALVPSLKLSFDSFDRHCSRPLYVCSQQDQVVNQRVAQAYCHFQS